MKSAESLQLFDGKVGKVETLIDEPTDQQIDAITLVAHPHPLFGGTHTNKVVHTLAKTFARMGCVALRPNFRGVGKTEGVHDHGEGETLDMLLILDQARAIYGELPIILSGFSFGAYVQTLVGKALLEAGTPAQRLVLVGAAAGNIDGLPRTYGLEAVKKDTLVIHGAEDMTVPLANVLDWAKPLDIPVVVIPGADHFFHQKLHIIRDIVLRSFGA